MSRSFIQTSLSVRHEMEPGMYPNPNQFVHQGWVRYLPLSAIVILNIISMDSTAGMTTQETIEDIKELLIRRKKDRLFFDFNAKPPKGKRALEEYEADLQRESQIRDILERFGFYYPQSVEDMIDLFKKFGLVFEMLGERGPVFDVLLGPYPHVSDVLKVDESDVR